MSSDWAAKLAVPSKSSSPTSTNQNTPALNSPTPSSTSNMSSLAPNSSPSTINSNSHTNSNNNSHANSPHPRQHKKTSSNGKSKKPPKSKDSVVSSEATSNTGSAEVPMVAPDFNAKEILSYLSSSFNSYLQDAKNDKSGDTIKVYRSLESSSQWKTSKVSNENGGNTNGNKNRYTPKEVIRSGNKSDTLDLMFEINRSIYQQQKEQKEK